MRSVTILDPGPMALFQDLGRPGHAHLGVPRSGAADRGALRLVNRLLGNPEGAAAIECLFGGVVLRAESLLELGVAGAPAPAFVDDLPVGHASRLVLRPGQVLRLSFPQQGARSYIGVRGGFAPHAVLGSRSTCSLSGLGPPKVKAGLVAAVGESTALSPPADFIPTKPMPSDGPVILRGLWGPRRERCPQGLSPASGVWIVAEGSDRVGVRLVRGQAKPEAAAGTWPSEPLAHGSVQASPSGELICFLADHPTTGGYPVVCVLNEASTDLLAQLRPGEQAVLVAG